MGANAIETLIEIETHLNELFHGRLHLLLVFESFLLLLLIAIVLLIWGVSPPPPLPLLSNDRLYSVRFLI